MAVGLEILVCLMDHKAHKDRRVIRAIKDHKAVAERLEYLAQVGNREPGEPKAVKGVKAVKVVLGRRGIKVIKGNLLIGEIVFTSN